MGSLPQLSIVKGSQRSLTPKLLHRIFEQNVDKLHGTKPALIFDNKCNGTRTTNYNSLNSSANRIANAILKLTKDSEPNGDGDFIVAVCMAPSDNLVTTLLSIWKAGAAYLPLDISFPLNRIEHILNEARPILVIYDDDYGNVEVFNSTKSTSFGNLQEFGAELSNANIDPEKTLTREETDLGLVLYTSGSTGIPKGVRLPHSIVLNRLLWQWNRFPYSETEIYGIFKTALTFVDSVTEIWGPLLSGMAIVVVPKKVTQDPEQLVELLELYKIERLVLVPTLLRSLLVYLSINEQSNLLYNLKIWVCSGEPLSLQLSKEFFDYFQENVHILCNFYGSTEVMGDVTYFVCESKKQLESYDKIPIGYPVDNTVIYLLDSDYRPVKTDGIGELFVSGLNLADGYVNKRDPDRFIENPMAVDIRYSRLYKTGDFASLQKGVIYYEGRTDSQIKIRGHRVDLSEIEKNLTTVKGIEKSFVLCYHAGEVDQALLGFVTLADGHNIATGLQVESALKDKLPHYMIPQVIVLDSFPLLVNGKIDRQSLLKMYENTNNNDDSQIEIEYDYTGVPESQMETAKVLFETIGQIIGRSTRTKLSVNSNFYELGGNSLNSIFTVAELRNKGYYVSITFFISATNLGQILDKICDTADVVNQASLFDDLQSDNQMNLKAVPLAKEHRDETIEIISASFFEKAELEQLLKPHIQYTDYGDILKLIWDVLIEKNLSFLVKDGDDRTVGVSLNFDARDEPEVLVNSHLIIIFEFLEHLEGPIRDNQLPSGLNQILHSFMMGTIPELNAQMNISVMNFMENEVLEMAKTKKFAGIFTTNTSPLTQQLGSNVYGYKTMLDYQVNQYEYRDGSKPFEHASESQRAIVHWKDIRNLN